MMGLIYIHVLSTRRHVLSSVHNVQNKFILVTIAEIMTVLCLILIEGENSKYVSFNEQ